MAKWLSLFKFSWLRKCKVCRVRGAKCLCKRPSLALEHIFFLEERKNKFGARNFSHVSDTMVTSASTLNSTNNTVLMRGSSFGDEYAFVDYYYNPNQTSNGVSVGPNSSAAPRPSLTGSGNRSSRSHSNSSSRGSLDKKKSSRAKSTAATTTTIVRKHSGRMVPSGGSRRRFEELPNEYTLLYSDHTTSSLAKTRSTSYRNGSRNNSSRRRPLRLQSSDSVSNKEEIGCSFKFYGRGGHSSSVATSASTFNSSRGPLASGRGFGSKNDSLVLSSSATSSMRLSSATDRMSVDNNFGSYNPRGLFLENGYASTSILENSSDDSDSEALQQLNGWLQASPTSTAGSFAAPRNIHCF